jgi:hypothetical protein
MEHLNEAKAKKIRQAAGRQNAAERSSILPHCDVVLQAASWGSPYLDSRQMTLHMRGFGPVHGLDPDRRVQPDVPIRSATGVPMTCPRPMRPAVLTVPPLPTLLGTLLMALLALPRSAMMAPAILRMKPHRRA